MAILAHSASGGEGGLGVGDHEEGVLVVWIVVAVEMVLRLLEIVYAPFYALFLVGPAALAFDVPRARARAREPA